jgi:hypothetical protein
MVVHFNRLADGSFLPASYRRLGDPGEAPGDRLLLEEATAAFLEAAARLETISGAAARATKPARHLPRLHEVPV